MNGYIVLNIVVIFRPSNNIVVAIFFFSFFAFLYESIRHMHNMRMYRLTMSASSPHQQYYSSYLYFFSP